MRTKGRPVSTPEPTGSTQVAPSATTDAPAGPPTSGPRKSLWFLRVVALLHTASIVLQPVFAGRYLTGDVDAIAVHEVNAHTVSLLSWIQIIAALLYAWRGRARYWPLWFTLALAFAEQVQTGFGYARAVDFHLPLGVTLITLQVLFTIWVWRGSARRGRPHAKGGRS